MRGAMDKTMNRTLSISIVIAVAWAVAGEAPAAPFPPLATEINADHPLFLFQVTGVETADPAAYAQAVTQVWGQMPLRLRPFATLQIDVWGPDPAARHERYRTALAVLQQANIPVVARVADADPARIYPMELIEALLAEFGCVKGLQANGLSFNEYVTFGGGVEFALPPTARWVMAASELCARYGRFLCVQAAPLDWVRMTSNPAYRPLYDKLRECRGYVIPALLYRGQQTIAGTSALMGLWLEDAVAQWGVAPLTQWYQDANFQQPGVFGPASDPNAMPPALYRAMICNGAMTGASVYVFSPGGDLWFGDRKRYWDQAIYPALMQLVDGGLIARKDFVQKKVRVAYQMTSAKTPQEFHAILRDVDGVFDQGLLLHGAYGMERPGQVPELIPNNGRHYWTPVLSAFAPPEAWNGYAQVVKTGQFSTSQDWTRLLDQQYLPDGTGTAFITRVGRAVFILNTRENIYEAQPFSVADMPAPVRGLEAKRDAAGVVLTWPFREGDVAYRVYRRVLPETMFSLTGKDLDAPTWTDADADPTASLVYAVTALTDSKEIYEGTVNYGDCLALSAVESRIAEEAVITPALSYGKGAPVAPSSTMPVNDKPWWPTFDGVPETHMPIANAIVKRLEEFGDAFARKDLESIANLYASDYEDIDGWRHQYVRRAYQWFFDRYSAPNMARQIRHWDFSAYEAGGAVKVLLYCRLSGVAVSDPAGRVGDLEAHFPRTPAGEVWFTFTAEDGAWRIATTTPALPNFRDILGFSTGPFDNYVLGADAQQ